MSAFGNQRAWEEVKPAMTQGEKTEKLMHAAHVVIVNPETTLKGKFEVRESGRRVKTEARSVSSQGTPDVLSQWK